MECSLLMYCSCGGCDRDNASWSIGYQDEGRRRSLLPHLRVVIPLHQLSLHWCVSFDDDDAGGIRKPGPDYDIGS